MVARKLEFGDTWNLSLESLVRLRLGVQRKELWGVFGDETRDIAFVGTAEEAAEYAKTFEDAESEGENHRMRGERHEVYRNGKWVEYHEPTVLPPNCVPDGNGWDNIDTATLAD